MLTESTPSMVLNKLLVFRLAAAAPHSPAVNCAFLHEHEKLIRASLACCFQNLNKTVSIRTTEWWVMKFNMLIIMIIKVAYMPLLYGTCILNACRIMCNNVSLFRIYCVLINIGICKWISCMYYSGIVLFGTYHANTKSYWREYRAREREGREGEIVRWDPNSTDNVIYHGSFIEHYLQSVDKHDKNIFFSVCFNRNHQIIKSGFGSWKCVYFCVCVYSKKKIKWSTLVSQQPHPTQYKSINIVPFISGKTLFLLQQNITDYFHTTASALNIEHWTKELKRICRIWKCIK